MFKNLLMSLLILIILASCGKELSVNNNSADKNLCKIKMIILDTSDPIFQSIVTKVVVTVSANDMNTITQNLAITDTAVQGIIYGIAAGENRLFYVACYDGQNVLQYSDSTFATIYADSTIDIPITVMRLSGNANVSISANEATNHIFGIGENYGGGIIFYIDSTGQHGLIAPPIDQSFGMPYNGTGWGCDETFLNVTDTAIGTGLSNTIKMLSECPENESAAGICQSCTYNGYTDWYLPSKNELHLLCLQANIVGGGLDCNAHWCSSEVDTFNAWYLGGNNQFTGSKASPNCVRAIRSF
jgi:hypothetical protein